MPPTTYNPLRMINLRRVSYWYILMAMATFRLFLVSLIIVIPSTSHATTLREFLVGGTIKTMARVFVKTSNLTRLKTKYIKQIATMKDDKFRRNYSKFYVVYTQLPPDLKESYSFRENATKTEIIAIIERVNKKDLFTIINKVPSEFIVAQTRYYSQPKDKQQEPVDEKRLWKRIIEKV